MKNEQRVLLEFLLNEMCLELRWASKASGLDIEYSCLDEALSEEAADFILRFLIELWRKHAPFPEGCREDGDFTPTDYWTALLRN